MAENDSKSSSENSLDFRYLKSGLFRVVHADGAWGGISTNGEIHMIIFAERPEIPDSVTYAITDDGRLGKEIAVKGVRRPVRECEADVVLNLGVAKALQFWLTEKINALEGLIAQGKESDTK